MLFPEQTEYDELGKRMLDLGQGPLLLWVAQWKAEEMQFDEWSPTELTIPGVVQRICDAVAYLTAPNGVPLAGIVEVQTKPDNDIFDRIGVAGHILRLTDRKSVV